MKTLDALDSMAAVNGSKLLTPAAYTPANLKPFRAFRPSANGAHVSVLKARASTEKSGVDVLTDHIIGGVATGINTPDLIVCQSDMFTDITFADQNITVFF